MANLKEMVMQYNNSGGAEKFELNSVYFPFIDKAVELYLLIETLKEPVTNMQKEQYDAMVQEATQHAKENMIQVIVYNVDDITTLTNCDAELAIGLYSELVEQICSRISTNMERIKQKVIDTYQVELDGREYEIINERIGDILPEIDIEDVYRHFDEHLSRVWTEEQLKKQIKSYETVRSLPTNVIRKLHSLQPIWPGLDHCKKSAEKGY